LDLLPAPGRRNLNGGRGPEPGFRIGPVGVSARGCLPGRFV